MPHPVRTETAGPAAGAGRWTGGSPRSGSPGRSEPRPDPPGTGIPSVFTPSFRIAPPSEGCGDLVEAAPDGIHVDLAEFRVHPVREENVDAPGVRIDPQGRSCEAGVSEGSPRQPAAGGGAGVRGEQITERAMLPEPRGEVCSHELALPFIQEAGPGAKNFARHPEDGACGAEEPRVGADAAKGAGIEVVYLAPRHLRSPSIVAVPFRPGEDQIGRAHV